LERNDKLKNRKIHAGVPIPNTRSFRKRTENPEGDESISDSESENMSW
jgi:hypothetical protein